MSTLVLNKNFKIWASTALLAASRDGDGGHNGGPISTKYGSLKDTTNTARTPYLYDASGTIATRTYQFLSLRCFHNNNTKQRGYTFFGVGNGSNPATDNDFSLQTSVDSVSINVISAINAVSTDGLNTITFSLSLTASEVTTIREIGIFKSASTTTGSSTEIYDFLLGRAVFDEDVTISTTPRTFDLVVEL